MRHRFGVQFDTVSIQVSPTQIAAIREHPGIVGAEAGVEVSDMLSAFLGVTLQEKIKEFQHVQSEYKLQQSVIDQMEADRVKPTRDIAEQRSMLDTSWRNFQDGNLSAAQFFAQNGIRDGRSDFIGVGGAH